MKAPDTILIIKLGALGDVVQAFGPMAAIRRHHPDAHITLLTTAPYADLARRSGYADDIWIDTRPKWYRPDRWLALKRKLNGGHFTRVYDLQNSDRTAFYFTLLSPRPQWVGTARGASHENNDPARTAGHAFDGHIHTLGKAGIDDVALDTLEWMHGDTAHFGLPVPYVLIVPGASASRPKKRWPPESYGTLCRWLLDRGLQPVLIGDAHEQSAARRIRAIAPDAIDLTGRTQVTDLPALARGAVFAVGNDTGPMHLIAPTGCRSLVLFSADSDPVRHKPLGRSVYTLQQRDLAALAPETVQDFIAKNLV